jgi:hypothetical protein
MNYENSENPSSHENPFSPLFSHQLLIGQRHKQNPITDWTENHILNQAIQMVSKIREAQICKRRKPRSTSSVEAKAAKRKFGEAKTATRKFARGKNAKRQFARDESREMQICKRRKL